MIKFLKQSLLSFAILGISVAVGMIFLIAAYSLPTGRIRTKVKESANIFEREGEGPKLWHIYATALDNYTDAIMLLEASNQDGENAVERAMINYWNRTITDGKIDNPVPTLINLSKAESVYSETDGNLSVTQYSRYWHGYLVILKPALLLFNYGQIRIINLLLQLMIDVYIVRCLIKNKFIYLAYGYICAMLVLSPVTCGLSMQYSSCWYIFSFGTIAVLRKYGKSKHRFDAEDCTYIFLIIGIATAYFDFLTYPITTFCIPAIVLIVICRSGDAFLKQVFKLAKLAILWAVGYIGMWGAKWVFASLITDNNIIVDAFESVAYRTSGEGTFIMAAFRNIGAFLFNPITVITIIIWILLICKQLNGKRIFSICSAKIGTLAVIALAPFLWYLIATGHSYVHFWFTFRNLVVCIIAGFASIEILNQKR